MSSENDNVEPPASALDYFSRLLNSAEEKGKQLSEESRKLTQSGQQIADMARAIRPIAQFVPPNGLELLINDWEVVNKQADQALGQVKIFSSGSINSTAGTAALSTSSIFNPSVILPQVPPSERFSAEESIIKLQYVLNRAADEQEVISLMIELGLDHAPKGRKSPMSLFITAHQAFNVPVTPDNPIITSLIPIREAIEHTIEYLLKKRPLQEETGAWVAKIRSIGKQLKHDAVPLETIESWAKQWAEMLDHQLSPAKEQDISRDEWHSRLQQATLFLKAMLTGLDPQKVNRKKGHAAAYKARGAA